MIAFLYHRGSTHKTRADISVVFKPSEFAIINTDGHSDFDIEDSLTLRDQSDRVLNLRINYMWVCCHIHREVMLNLWLAVILSLEGHSKHKSSAHTSSSTKPGSLFGSRLFVQLAVDHKRLQVTSARVSNECMIIVGGSGSYLIL